MGIAQSTPGIMERKWKNLRSELLNAFNSIHWLTFTTWLYEDYPDEEIRKDTRLWLHMGCTLFFQTSIASFKIAHLVQEKNFYEFMVSLTAGLVITLVAIRTYVFYSRLASFRRLYFKPEIFYCNKHRPSSSLPRLIQVVKHCRNLGLSVIILFATFDVSLLVLPIIQPIVEMTSGTNKTYDELFPSYPSINPVSIWWLRKEIKYAYDLSAAVFNTVPWVGFVVIYYSVVNLIIAQYSILSMSLEPCHNIPGDEPAPMDMRLWIEDHALLRKLVFELRDTMSPALGGSVAVSVFTLGLSMLQLTMAPIASSDPILVKILFYFNLTLYIALSLSDLFIHCKLAAEITHNGVELKEAIYQSDWYKKLNRPHQEFVLPIMICEKPIRMTAFSLIPVSIQTFTEAVRLSYSYYTLLSRT